MMENQLVAIDLENAVSLPKEEVQAFIMSLEDQLKQEVEIQVEVPVVHYHANTGSDKGLYAREIKMTKGTLLVGKIHRLETINVVSSGEVSVLSIDGVVRTKAPYTFVSSPGAKRVIYAHEDSVWTCFHATGETDLDKIEDEFIAKSFEQLQLEGDV